MKRNWFKVGLQTRAIDLAKYTKEQDELLKHKVALCFQYFANPRPR